MLHVCCHRSYVILLIMSSYLLNVSCCFYPIINVVIFSAIRLNTGIFLNWPIREILSLYFLPNRTKVSLFCYSARYQYPYFQVQIDMENTGNRLLRFRKFGRLESIFVFSVSIDCLQDLIVSSSVFQFWRDRL